MCMLLSRCSGKKMPYKSQVSHFGQETKAHAVPEEEKSLYSKLDFSTNDRVHSLEINMEKLLKKCFSIRSTPVKKDVLDESNFK